MSDIEPADDVIQGFVGDRSPDRIAVQRFVLALGRSARAAGAGAVVTGRWLADLVLEYAPRVPIRDLESIRAHHNGLTGAALAADLIRSASRSSAAVGAATGAAVSAGQLAPPSWIVVPFELAAETVLIALIEIKLIAELHEVYGHPVQGAVGSRAGSLVRAWAERRGVSADLLATPGGLADALGRGTRNELTRLLRRRLAGRMGRNLSSLAPLLTGAIAGAEINRRATKGLGESVVRDLADRSTQLALPAGPAAALQSPANERGGRDSHP